MSKQSDNECCPRSMCVVLWTLSPSGKVKSCYAQKITPDKKFYLNQVTHLNIKSKNCKTSQRKQTFVKVCDAFVHDDYWSVLVFFFFWLCIVFVCFWDQKKKGWPPKMRWKCSLFYFLKENVCKISTIISFLNG